VTHIPAAFRRKRQFSETAQIFIEEMAESLGITVAEAMESVDRLIAAGWLTPDSNGNLVLTAPYGAR
jgi:hypothetical protein